jgi:hypothetical protein
MPTGNAERPAGEHVSLELKAEDAKGDKNLGDSVVQVPFISVVQVWNWAVRTNTEFQGSAPL